MNDKKVWYRTIGIIVLAIFIVSTGIVIYSQQAVAPPFIIDGDSVYIDDAYVAITAKPHTLHSSGWVYFNLTSKQFSGDIDMVWGFDTVQAKPTKAELYKPHTVYWNSSHTKYVTNVTKIETTEGDCDWGYDYNLFKRNVTYYECEIGNLSNGCQKLVLVDKTMCFDSYVNNSGEYVINWHQEHSRIDDWVDVTDRFNSINYEFDGFNKWYYVTDVTIQEDINYQLRAYIDVPISLQRQEGKYGVAIKRSSDTIQEAISSGNFYYLDPWWNSSWGKCKNVTISNPTQQSLYNFTIYLNVSYDSDMQADFDDIRFLSEGCSVGGAELDYEKGDINDSNYGVFYVRVPALDNGDTVIAMYYNNTGASSGEDPDNAWDKYFLGVWHLGENGTGARLDSTKHEFDLTTQSYEGTERTIGTPTNVFDTTDADLANRAYEAGMTPDNSSWTVESFFKSGDAPEYATMFAYIRTGSPYDGIMLMHSATNTMRCRLGGGGETDLNGVTNTEDSVWRHGACRINNSMGYLILNGFQEANSATIAELPYGFTYELSSTSANTHWPGSIDEVRLSNTSRTNEWLNMTYQNVVNFGTIIVFGAEEELASNLAPNASIPSITPLPAYTNNNLNCSTIPTDAENASLMVEFSWWKNGAPCAGCGYDVNLSTTNNTQTFTTNLVTENKNVGENWTCRARAWDGDDWSGHANGTIQISNTLPSWSQTPDDVSYVYNVNVSYDVNATDVDTNANQDLQYFINTTFFDINNNTGAINRTTVEADIGTYDIRVNVSDSLSWLNATFVITISNVSSSNTPVVENVTISSTSGNNYTEDNWTMAWDVDNGDAEVVWNTTWFNTTGKEPVLIMDFNKENSTGVHDLSPYNNDGTIAGATWTASGYYGGAYDFDADDDVITSTVVGFNDTQTLTLNGWVKRLNTNNHLFFTVGTSNGEYYLDFRNGNSYLVINTDDTSFSNFVSLNVPANQWVMVTVVYNGTKVYLYMNGTETTSAIATGDTSLNSEALRIGLRTDNIMDFNGTIDEVRVYNYAMSSTQIQQLYTNDFVLRALETSIDDIWTGHVVGSDNASYSTETTTTFNVTHSCTPPAINSNWNVVTAHNCDKSNLDINLGTGNLTTSGSDMITLTNTNLTVQLLNLASGTQIALDENSTMVTG